MSAEGDVVFVIGADVTGLTRAGQAGEQSLAEMEKAAKVLERQIGKIGEAGVAFQREMNKLTGVTSEFSKSARDSAAAFEAFDKARAQVDNLKASIDPLFAASKRYEGALMQLDSALEMGAISAREHANMVDALAASYLRADGAAQTMGGGLGFLGGMSSQTQGKLQQVGFQIQDFAVQVGAGTSATQAFAQQFPQMAGAFGPWGSAVGTAAAVLVPLGMAFFAASQEADKLSESMERQTAVSDALVEATKRLRLEREMMSSGALFSEEQEAMNELVALADERARLQIEYNALTRENIDGTNMVKAAEAGALAARMQAIDARRRELEAQLESLNLERAKKTAAEAAKTVAEQMQVVMNQLASANISSPWQSVLGWIQQATEAAKRYAQASMVYSGRGGDPRDFGAMPGTSNTFDTENFTAPETGTGGGGGGGGTNPVQAQLESLRQQLMTEEQLEMESWARRQEMLQQALDQRLLTQQEYAALMEQAQQQHSDKMSQIDVWRYGSTLDKASTFFGDMASALQGGNDRMAKIAKKFAAAEALINAWRAFSQTMADPTLPFIAKIPSAISALAAGMSAVSALGGGGGGGAGGVRGAAGAGATQQQQAPTQTMNFTVTNDPFGFGERLVRQLVTQLNEAQRNGSSIRATFGTA